jgi:hypothetical protein
MTVDVMAVARSIGLVADVRGQLSGTIDEAIVLGALAELAAGCRGHDDLFADAALRVRLARSAGVEEHEPNSLFNPTHTATSVQLRYRVEMAEVFTDLAIDLGLRRTGELAIVSS